MQCVVRNFPSTDGGKYRGLCPYLAFVFWVTNEWLASGGTVFNFFSLSTHFFETANKSVIGTSLVSLCSWFIAVRCSVNVYLEVALVQFITSNLNGLRACHYFLWSFQIPASSYIIGTRVLPHCSHPCSSCFGMTVSLPEFWRSNRSQCCLDNWTLSGFISFLTTHHK